MGKYEHFVEMIGKYYYLIVHERGEEVEWVNIITRYPNGTNYQNYN